MAFEACRNPSVGAVQTLTKRRHRLRGELSVSDSEQTEGEQLTALGSFEPFPFRHGSRRDTFPARGDSFWVALPPVGAAIVSRVT